MAVPPGKPPARCSSRGHGNHASRRPGCKLGLRQRRQHLDCARFIAAFQGLRIANRPRGVARRGGHPNSMRPRSCGGPPPSFSPLTLPTVSGLRGRESRSDRPKCRKPPAAFAHAGWEEVQHCRREATSRKRRICDQRSHDAPPSPLNGERTPRRAVAPCAPEPSRHRNAGFIRQQPRPPTTLPDESGVPGSRFMGRAGVRGNSMQYRRLCVQHRCLPRESAQHRTLATDEVFATLPARFGALEPTRRF